MLLNWLRMQAWNPWLFRHLHRYFWLSQEEATPGGPGGRGRNRPQPQMVKHIRFVLFSAGI